MLRKNLDELEKGQVGDWAFLQDNEYLAIKWGADLAGIAIVHIEEIGNPIPSSSWCWNGSFDKPSLTPSISIWGDGDSVVWHGWLIDGILKEG